MKLFVVVDDDKKYRQDEIKMNLVKHSLIAIP